MPSLSRQTIEDVRRRASLVEIASRYTNLKRSGAQFRGLSPFAEEKTPSFYIHPEKNVFYCYSTQESGDVFGFVQKMENLSFQEAVETLAERYGVPLEYEQGGPSREELSLRKQVLLLHEQACQFFANAFQDSSDEGKKIQEYWTEERGFAAKTAKDLSIGYAPSDTRSLHRFLTSQKFSDRVLEASGLFFQRRSARDDFYPRFRGRLMIPIRDIQERVIAFTARVTPLTPEDDRTREAKYVNSPETLLFHKGKTVFGLERASKAVRHNPVFLLVEGQLDVIRCWENDIPEAIALQGTAASADQFYLLRRYCERVDILLDGDSAGKRAAYRMIEIGYRAGIELRFAPLPEGADPDDLLRKEGKEALQTIRKEALSSLEFAMRTLAPNPGRLDAVEKNRILEELYALLFHMRSEVTREDYLDRIAAYFRADPSAIRSDYRNAGRRQSGFSSRPEETNPSREGLQLTGEEEVLLYLVLHFETLREKLSQTAICEWITETTNEANLLKRILSDLAEGSFVSVESFYDDCESDEERKLLARLMAHSTEFKEPEVVAEHTAGELLRKFANGEISRIVEQLNNCKEGDDFIRTLQNKRRELRAMLSDPKRFLYQH